MSGLIALHTLGLLGSDARVYLQALDRTLEAARLGRAHADRSRLQALLRALALGLEREIYGELLIDSRSGFPNLASVTRVATDRELANAPGFLAELGALQVPTALARASYLRQMSGSRALSADETTASLRRSDPDGAVFVRFDLTKLDAEGRFIRVMVDVRQDSARGNACEVRDSVVTVSDAFHATIYRYASLDAELLFARLQEIKGIVVEGIERGTLGPFLFRVGEDASVFPSDAVVPGPLEGIWARMQTSQAPHETLLSITRDQASLDLAQDRCNDPFAEITANRLAGIGQSPYHVFKDRKFVATRAVAGELAELLKQRGARNLVIAIDS